MNHQRTRTVTAVIVGAGGYSGAELASILLGHPGAKIVGLFASGKRDKSATDASPDPMSKVFPRFRTRLELPVLPTDVDKIARLKPDVAFLCTPHEASLELAPAILSHGIKVLDLSAAFRLKHAPLYLKHYGFEHNQPAWLANAIYGLPELFREQIRSASLVACPGCYPTSAILPLAPLVRAGATLPGRRPIVDSTSGVSGAGRSPALKSLFCEVSQQPYGVFSHRHNPEIDAYAGIQTVFTPQLGPFERGILSTIHADLAPGVDEAAVRRLLAQAYAAEPFVRLCPPGVWPAVADVANTNFCDIALAVDPAHGHLIIASAIDNLVKGAAGQAVQCMNLLCGLEESCGLGATRARAEPLA